MEKRDGKSKDDKHWTKTNVQVHIKNRKNETEKLGENLLDRDKEGVKNNKETDWEGRMRNEEGEMIQEMKNLITIDMEQTIQEDWARVESLKYCPYFKSLKTDIIIETYWTDKDKDEKKNNYGQELDMGT